MACGSRHRGGGLIAHGIAGAVPLYEKSRFLVEYRNSFWWLHILEFELGSSCDGINVPGHGLFKK
jgi:hypothetical protein